MTCLLRLSKLGIYWAAPGVLITLAPPVKPLVRFGSYEFEPYSGELRRQGIRVHLEGQPLAILKILLERPGDLVTREDLQKELWRQDTFVDFEHSLNAAVKRLRAALNDSADHPRYIETLARRGYRFVAPVNGVNSRSETSGVSPSAAPVVPVFCDRSLWLRAGLVLFTLAVVIAGWRQRCFRCKI